MNLKNNKRGRIHEYADKFGAIYHEGKDLGIFHVISLYCATQNEIDFKRCKRSRKKWLQHCF